MREQAVLSASFVRVDPSGTAFASSSRQHMMEGRRTPIFDVAWRNEGWNLNAISLYYSAYDAACG
jgi:hypothetical protein